MSAAKDKFGDLSDFAQLDLAELYYLGDRQVVERGLRYFRDYAVDSLFWDEENKQLVAQISGSSFAPYEVVLYIREGQLEHECDCPAWEKYGNCKHCVAALAAVFAVLHGFQAGSPSIPEDYIQLLRSGLGLGPDGRLPEQHGKADKERAGAATVLKVVDNYSYGGMRLRVLGPVPHGFLRSVGLHLPSTYGGAQSREFFMGDLSRSLEPFLKKAHKAGIAVKIRTEAGEVDLRSAEEDCRAVVEYDLSGREVRRRIVFHADAEAVLDVEECLAERLVLVADGALYKVSNADQIPGELADEGFFERYSIEAFNSVGLLCGLDKAWQVDGACRFLRSGEPVSPEVCKPDSIGLELHCSIYENAANEPELFEFCCYARVGEVLVDLGDLIRECLAAILHTYGGGLLSAKRRVSALLDLIRRYISAYEAGTAFDAADCREEFPEILGDEFRYTVLSILKNLKDFLRYRGQAMESLAVDPVAGRFLRYSLDMPKLAMLLFSMSAVDSRRGLHQLAEGALTIRRGTSGRDVLGRVLTAAQALGVSVRVDDLPVRREPLSISVDARTKGSDIDWFALHPSIACGERTIKPDEWRDLIRGELLLRGEDGALIMPEAGEGAAAGLQALAAMLRVDRMSGRAALGETAQVSRLQMLDWIALRRHGIKVALPAEAEKLFESLLELRGLPEFEPPKGCAAELRKYQREGCAWIDFLFQHRFGACLADDMGLGKTVQTIAFLVACFERGLKGKGGAPVLIVLPPSLVFNWLDEWARFAPAVQVRDCLKKSDWKGALSEAEVILTTYDRVRLDSNELESERFEIVVFDEAHNLKNITAARTRAAARLRRRFTLCLTGTPVENNASEFYLVLSAAVPGIFGTHKDFKEAFRTRPDQILGRARPFILRRTKKAILKELPSKEEHVLNLQMTALQKEIYTRTVAEVREEIAEAFADKPEQQAGIVALAAILRLRQVCVSPALLGKQMPEVAPKFAYMADKLEELHAEGHAALVFSQFIGGLDGLEAEAAARGLNYLRMDGRTPVAKRKGIVEQFQSAEGPPFFFISLKTGGVGLNLTRANYVFHLDPWWNPAVENQATDRAHRIGQKRAVFVQRLIMEHSIESRMMELKKRKADLFRQLVEQPGAKSAKAGLSRADFEYLLEG